MKRFLFLALISLMIVSINISSAEADPYRDFFKSGNCKVTKISDSEYGTATFVYDSNGNIKEIRNNDAAAVEKFTYNSSGRLQKIETYWDGNLEEVEYYYYNSDGKVGRTEQDCWGDGDICEIYDYKYLGGKLIEISSRSYDDEYDKFKYDTAGRLVEMEFWCCGHIESRSIFHYDGGDKIMRIEHRDIEDGSVSFETFSWDCSGKSGGKDDDSTCFIRVLR